MNELLLGANKAFSGPYAEWAAECAVLPPNQPNPMKPRKREAAATTETMMRRIRSERCSGGSGSLEGKL